MKGCLKVAGAGVGVVIAFGLLAAIFGSSEAPDVDEVQAVPTFTSTPLPVIEAPVQTEAPTPITAPTDVPTLAPSPTDTPIPSPTGASANNTANLRQGPGADYAIVGSTQTGQLLELVARTSDSSWYKLATGVWIAAFLVENAPTDLPFEDPPPLPTPVPLQVIEPPVNCEPSYPDFCLPTGLSDLSCRELREQYSQCNIRVNQPDPHGFDGNKDGRGCEACD